MVKSLGGVFLICCIIHVCAICNHDVLEGLKCCSPKWEAQIRNWMSILYWTLFGQDLAKISQIALTPVHVKKIYLTNRIISFNARSKLPVLKTKKALV